MVGRPPRAIGIHTMQVEFELTEDDLIAFNRKHLMQSRKLWAGRVAFLVCASSFVIWVLWVLPPLIYGSTVNFVGYQVLGGVCFGLLILYDVLRWRGAAQRGVLKMLRRGHGRSVLGQHRLSISSDYVCAETPAGEQETKWHAIWKIVVTNDYAFIYNTPYSALVVPRRAFDNEDAFKAFVNQAVEFHQQSQAYGLVCEKCGFDLRGVAELGCPECGWKREG